MINKAELLTDNTLIRTVADTKRNTETIKTTQLVGTDSINMQPTGARIATSTSIADGSATLFKWDLKSSIGQMIFATFQFTLYQDSVAEANAIGHANTLGYQYRWYHWTDWQAVNDTWPDGGYHSTEYVWIENHTGSPHTIIMKGEWRYIVNGGSVTIT